MQDRECCFIILNPAQQLTYDMVTKGAGAVCPENLRPVIDWYNSVK